jgi:hypothetical protein
VRKAIVDYEPFSMDFHKSIEGFKSFGDFFRGCLICRI